MKKKKSPTTEEIAHVKEVDAHMRQAVASLYAAGRLLYGEAWPTVLLNVGLPLAHVLNTSLNEPSVQNGHRLAAVCILMLALEQQFKEAMNEVLG